MKIAILGWGSLIYDHGEMLLEGKWECNGPVLKIEFSRISSDGRLTLVIDPGHGSDITTQYATSGRSEIEDAVCDLMIREGTNRDKIGMWIRQSSGNVACNHPSIRDWLDDSDFDGVIWTNLKSNFEKKQNADFSNDSALRYLEALSPICKANARNYINKAPEQTQTRLREFLKTRGWL